jgi:hypothetical protein
MVLITAGSSPRVPTPPVALRCRAANKDGTLSEACKHRGLSYIGVHAPVQESGPHGIGVESLTVQHRCDLV